MDYRPLGRSGIKVSKFGLGTMVLGAWGNSDVDACSRIINKALDAGINLLDTADVYGEGQNERIVGLAIANRRDEIVLCTKFHHAVEPDEDPNRQGNSRRWIMRAIDDSLKRLNTDYIDLYQVHRPDPTVAIEETVEALSDLVRMGKIRAWGTSTFPAEDLVETLWAARRCGAVGPHTEQPPYSILCRGAERDILPVAQRYGMGTLAWSPLSGGWLTGKYRRDTPPPPGSRGDTNPDHFDGTNHDKLIAVEALATIADKAGLSLTHMSLAWATEHPALSAALIGPRTEAQLDDLLQASDLLLTPDILDMIDTVVPPGTTINPTDLGWNPPGLTTNARRRRHS
ncbi:MAG: aldo/keto reductase [Acidimicrobiales bacterium]|nr:aldo/keto reductase [Acidimicrobiales bacterium]